MPAFSNYTYDELTVGQSQSLTRQVTEDDVKAFAMVTHDYNPPTLTQNMPLIVRSKKLLYMACGQRVWCRRCLVLSFLELGTIYLSQSLSFRRPVYVDDTLTATLTVKSKNDEKMGYLDM